MGLFSRSNRPSSTPVNRTAARTVQLVQDESGAAAFNLQTIEDQGGVTLRKKTEAVAVSLRKRNLSGIRAQVMVILDHSGSMSYDYENGKVQDLVDRFLAFGLTVDVDGEVPVVPFDSNVKQTVNVNMSNYQGVVRRDIYKPMQMGGTNLTAALEVVRDEAKKTDTPLFVAIVTDGEPNDSASAKEIVCDLARYPVYIKFLAVQPVSFLRELDDLGDDVRLLDNVDTKEYRDLNSVSDEQFAEDMADEWDSWTKAALAAGVLTNG
jgi:uncharacterized protein YegL